MPETDSRETAGEDVHSPRDDWYVDDEVVECGYRREALVDLFGEPTRGPDGLMGWTASSVGKIERVQLLPAYELLRSAFDAYNDAADTMTHRVYNSVEMEEVSRY